jgi:hypothetical protein
MAGDSDVDRFRDVCNCRYDVNERNLRPMALVSDDVRDSSGLFERDMKEKM